MRFDVHDPEVDDLGLSVVNFLHKWRFFLHREGPLIEEDDLRRRFFLLHGRRRHHRRVIDVAEAEAVETPTAIIILPIEELVPEQANEVALLGEVELMSSTAGGEVRSRSAPHRVDVEAVDLHVHLGRVS